MKQIFGFALAYLLLTAFAFPGDAAYFVDEGFSKDGSVYVFGQYGKTDKTYNSYAEIYTVDVAKNDFVPNGVFKVIPGKAPANESGFQTYEKLVAKSFFNLKQYDLKKTSADNLLYVCEDETKAGSEAIEFTDFELSTVENPVKWNVKLIPTVSGAGEGVSSSFYISVKKIDRNGNVIQEFKVGSPDVKRKGISGYKIEKIIRDSSKKNIVFVVEKTLQEKDGVSFRYMVETFSLK